MYLKLYVDANIVSTNVWFPKRWKEKKVSNALQNSKEKNVLNL